MNCLELFCQLTTLTKSWNVIADVVADLAFSRSISLLPEPTLHLNSGEPRASTKSGQGISPNPSGSNWKYYPIPWRPNFVRWWSLTWSKNWRQCCKRTLTKCLFFEYRLTCHSSARLCQVTDGKVSFNHSFDHNLQFVTRIACRPNIYIYIYIAVLH